MAIDMDYYRKIQNVNDSDDVRIAQMYEIQQKLNNDFGKTLDAHTVLIDGNEQDLTILKTVDLHIKKIKSRPNEYFECGQYVEWKGLTWIITEVDPDNSIITYGKMKQCNYLLRWQNETGEIVSRWCCVENASSYSNGETQNNYLTLQSNQFMVTIRYDDETKMLENGKRVHISKKTHICKPYELTRPDDVSFGYGEIGVLNAIFTQAQYNVNSDKLITYEDENIWICDYKEVDVIPTPPSPTYKMKIDYDSLYIRANGRNIHILSHLYDDDGNEITDNVQYNWTVSSEVSEYIKWSFVDNDLTINIDREFDEYGENVVIKCKSMYYGYQDEIKLEIQGAY